MAQVWKIAPKPIRCLSFHHMSCCRKSCFNKNCCHKNCCHRSCSQKSFPKSSQAGPHTALSILPAQLVLEWCCLSCSRSSTRQLGCSQTGHIANRRIRKSRLLTACPCSCRESRDETM